MSRIRIAVGEIHTTVVGDAPGLVTTVTKGASVEVLTFTIPLRTVSNAREHHMERSRRVNRERKVTWAAWLAAGARRLGDGESAQVTLTRISPRPLDAHENLPHSCKGIVDQLAVGLGLAKQDNSPRLSWSYAQRRGKPREHLVEVRVVYAASVR